MSRFLKGKYSGIFFPLILVLILNIPLEAVNVIYYSQGTGSFSTTSNWNSARVGGGGSTPGDIVSVDIFVIQSGHTITLDTGSNLISGLTVENGGTFDNGSSTLHVASTAATCSVDVQSGGTYTESTGGIEFSRSFGATPTFTLQSATSETFNNITLRDGAQSLSKCHHLQEQLPTQ